MVSIRDAWDGLRGRIEHGDDCECHRCRVETRRYADAYKRESDAEDRKRRERKRARKVVRRLAREHGADIARAMRPASVWDVTASQSRDIGDGLDCLTARLPYGSGRLVVSVTRDGSDD